MSKYMDKNGTLRQDNKNTTRQLRKAEAFINEFIKDGATIPEAHWAITCIFQTAFDNVRFKDTINKTNKK